MRKISFYIILLILTGLLFAQNKIISGRVIDSKTKDPITGASVYSGTQGTITNQDGEFAFSSDTDSISVSYIGYKKLNLPVTDQMEIQLTQESLDIDPVWVEATRAVKGITPVAFSSMSPKDIEFRHTVEDVPMVLSSEPGVFAYSESGNGTGYSYISIRGFDQSRIAVMLNGVPLNDNESHQVYWVDHADILSDAIDVQIQRGIGSSLYGSSAFGGSINVNTGPGNNTGLQLYAGMGSYNTIKSRIKYSSPALLDGRLKFYTRATFLNSDGYRDFHQSEQQSLSGGADYTGLGGKHEFRFLRGIERTNLAWDGVPASSINNREKRRQSYKAYIDDFVQDIYSLRSNLILNDNFRISNTAYLVKGKGFYETEKYSANVFDYNLDVNDIYPDSVEQAMDVGLLQRKWIVNSYYGSIPTITFENNTFRVDAGLEIRSYQGDHYGEVKNISDAQLISDQGLGTDWYEYYSYLGKKVSLTGFAHLSYKLNDRIRLVGDIQTQNHKWNLDQQELGHAQGYNLSADWNFINPRAGLILDLSDELFAFAYSGKGQKEPADAQIITADDVWGEPQHAAAEVINDIEVGFSLEKEKLELNFNYFNIDYSNQQIKAIDIDKEGEYDYTSLPSTVHTGFEMDMEYAYSKQMAFGMNATLLNAESKGGQVIPGVPDRLMNAWIHYDLLKNVSIFAEYKHVGEVGIHYEFGSKKISPYNLVNLKISSVFAKVRVNLKVNNLLDNLYSTQGYVWDTYYYWPGATRNFFLELETTL